jgi:hypothetical protein
MHWPWKLATAAKEEVAERRSDGRLDKVFPVWLEGERGIAHGVARNISTGGLFVETPVTQPIGSQVRVTFSAGAGEMVAVGEVRFVCALTGRPARASATGPIGVRGMGLRFLYFESAGAPGADPLH